MVLPYVIMLTGEVVKLPCPLSAERSLQFLQQLRQFRNKPFPESSCPFTQDTYI